MGFCPLASRMIAFFVLGACLLVIDHLGQDIQWTCVLISAKEGLIQNFRLDKHAGIGLHC